MNPSHQVCLLHSTSYNHLILSAAMAFGNFLQKVQIDKKQSIPKFLFKDDHTVVSVYLPFQFMSVKWKH